MALVYVVIWRGKTSTMFYRGKQSNPEASPWTFDAVESKSYQSWFVAKARAALHRGAEVACAWE